METEINSSLFNNNDITANGDNNDKNDDDSNSDNHNAFLFACIV